MSLALTPFQTGMVVRILFPQIHVAMGPTLLVRHQIRGSALLFTVRLR